MITAAESFVAQTQAILDDPDGPYTAGSPGEIVEWIAKRTVDTKCVPARANRPQHYLLELYDNSTVAVVVNDECPRSGRIADTRELRCDEDWQPNAVAWVLVGGQP